MAARYTICTGCDEIAAYREFPNRSCLMCGTELTVVKEVES